MNLIADNCAVLRSRLLPLLLLYIVIYHVATSSYSIFGEKRVPPLAKYLTRNTTFPFESLYYPKFFLKHDAGCPRYATHDMDPTAGLGHKYGNLVFGVLLALKLNATYVFDADSFHYSVLFDRQTYGHTINMWGFDAFEQRSNLNFKELSSVKLTNFSVFGNQPKSMANKCNVIFELCDQCCFCESHLPCHEMTSKYTNPASCFHYANGAYNYVKDVMRTLKKFAAPFTSPRMLFPARKDRKDSFVVSFHFRVGDLTLKVGDHFIRNVMSLMSFFHGTAYVFLDSKSAVFPTFSSDPVVIVRDMSVEDTLYHWCESDALVSTGSSFPYMAETSCNVPLFFSTTPKEGQSGAYELTETIWIDSNGLLLPRSQHQNIFSMFSARMFPLNETKV